MLYKPHRNSPNHRFFAQNFTTAKSHLIHRVKKRVNYFHITQKIVSGCVFSSSINSSSSESLEIPTDLLIILMSSEDKEEEEEKIRISMRRAKDSNLLAIYAYEDC